MYYVLVLIHTFGFLDDISLWSVGQVCTRWREIMNMFRDSNYWRLSTLMRWPLFKTLNVIQDWYEVSYNIDHINLYKLKKIFKKFTSSY